jgi:hypothetical protein
LLLGAAVACGSNGNSKHDSSIDTPAPGSDAGSGAETFTQFVINLVLNVGADTTPAAFSTFENLPDPDVNNGSAYASLF